MFFRLFMRLQVVGSFEPQTTCFALERSGFIHRHLSLIDWRIHTLYMDYLLWGFAFSVFVCVVVVVFFDVYFGCGSSSSEISLS